MNGRTTGTNGQAILDATQFAETAERITNQALTAEMLALYAPDAVVEWIIDGAYERHEGIDAIRPAATAMSDLWRARRLYVRKQSQCADADHVVLTYSGGFSGGKKLFGTEIWTLRDGLVVCHQMYAYLDVRPRTSLWAQIRVALMDPRTALRARRIDRNLSR